MFPIYKQRKANDLINDTFLFFRTYGKNYYGTYLRALGWILLLLVVFGFLFGKAFLETAMLGSQAPQSAQMLDEYFDANMDYFIGTGLLGGVVLLLLAIANYSYPVFYLEVMANTEQEPQPRQILSLLKRNTGRILLFGLISLFIFLPILALIMLLALLLMITIIGIPVALALFVFVYSWGALMFYEYITNKTDYFTALGRGWNLFFRNFWGHLGTSAVMLFIMYVMQGIIGVIPTVFGTGYFLADGTDATSAVSMWMILLFFILSSILGFLLGHLIMVSQGIIYYSSREMRENKGQQGEIDLIGRNFE